MICYASLISIAHTEMTESFFGTASLKSIKCLVFSNLRCERLAPNCEVRRNKSQPTFDPNPVRWRWRSVGVPVAD